MVCHLLRTPPRKEEEKGGGREGQSKSRARGRESVKFQWNDGQWEQGERPKKDTLWRAYVDRHPWITIGLCVYLIIDFIGPMIVDIMKMYAALYWDIPGIWFN